MLFAVVRQAGQYCILTTCNGGGPVSVAYMFLETAVSRGGGVDAVIGLVLAFHQCCSSQ